MTEITCRCGQIKKNFFRDIGPFFIGDCCSKAGYDALGNKPESKLPQQAQAQVEAIVAEVAPAIEKATSAVKNIFKKKQKKDGNKKATDI